MSTPSDEDITFPSTIYQGPTGETMSMLRRYWRERPDVSPPMQGTQIAMATWRDGTTTPVPKDAGPSELSAFYSGALAANVVREMQAMMLAGERP